MKNVSKRVYPMESVALINGVNQESVNARELYDFLYPLSKDPKGWFNRSIKDYEFKEGIDFVASPNASIDAFSTAPIAISNIQVSMVMAKELAMVAKSDFSRSYRRYLINMEANVELLRKAYEAEMQAKVYQLENKQVVEYFSAREFFESKGVLGVSKDAMRINGAAIKSFCINLGIPLHAVYNPVGKKVANLYPLGALEAWWKESMA